MNMDRQCDSRGYSLIELLIVIVILSLISAGLYLTFDSGQKEYGVRQATIRMQQQARLAMMNLEKDLKKIGYGFTNMGTLKFNAYASGAVTNWAMVSWTNNTVDASINNAPNTDSISFRYYEGPLDVESDVTLRADHPVSSANTPVSTSDSFTQGDFFLIFDPNNPAKPGSLLQATGFSNAAGADSVIHNSGNSPFNPPNATELFPAGGYPVGSIVLNLGSNNFAWRRYYVDANRNLVEQRRSVPSAALTSRVVAVGIEDLQLKYQFKDGTWRDAPVPNDANYDIENIRAIRVSIIARTEKPDNKLLSLTSFQMTGDNGNGIAYSGGGYRRQVLSSIISLRNMSLRK